MTEQEAVVVNQETPPAVEPPIVVPPQTETNLGGPIDDMTAFLDAAGGGQGVLGVGAQPEAPEPDPVVQPVGEAPEVPVTSVTDANHVEHTDILMGNTRYKIADIPEGQPVPAGYVSVHMARHQIQDRDAVQAQQSALDKVQSRLAMLEGAQTPSVTQQAEEPAPTDYAQEIKTAKARFVAAQEDGEIGDAAADLMRLIVRENGEQLRAEVLDPLTSSVQQSQGALIQTQLEQVNRNDLSVLTDVIAKNEWGIDPQSVFNDIRAIQGKLAEDYKASLAEVVSDQAMAQQIATGVIERHRRVVLEGQQGGGEPGAQTPPSAVPPPPRSMPTSAPGLGSATIPGPRSPSTGTGLTREQQGEKEFWEGEKR